MNTAIILAGGVGTRMGADIPKQFICVKDKPIITYCLEIFEAHNMIDNIVIVASEQWQDFISEQIKLYNITKFYGYAPPGATRQHSIFNGLKLASHFLCAQDIVIVHDAVRPLVSDQIITDCLNGAMEKDGALPVISVKDTVYQSINGDSIDKLLKREQLFAGQAPESFNFGKYYLIHTTVSDSEIASSVGSCVIAHRNGMDIKLVAGSERNIKITTKEDLDMFEAILDETERRAR